MDEVMLSSNDEAGAETEDEDAPVVVLDHSYSESPERLPQPTSVAQNVHISSTPKINASRAGEQSMDEDGQTCTICFEPWTNSSEHRLVSLRCGHLFGRSCITRWLKGQTSRCPQCNARARKSEIRNIYAKSVKVLDTTERDKALEELKREKEMRKNLELESARERFKYTMTLQECERLKKELVEAKRQLLEYSSNARQLQSTQSAKKNASPFSFEKNIEINKNGNCRIVDVFDLLGMILVSQPSSNELFPGYGFRKISTAEMRPSEFVLVHQKPIKDMSFHCHDGLVLTASLDKTVKITNVLTNSVVQTYSLDCDVWSCTWDSDDPTYFYSGMKTGVVRLFDIRFTNRFVKELPKFGSNTPVVSLQYLRKSDCSMKSKCGPFVGKLSDCSFYQKLDAEEYKITPLPCFGPFTSLSSEPVSGHFLISCRPSLKQPRISHMVCELVPDQEKDELVCNPVQTFLGGKNQLQLTRSRLLPHPNDSSSLLICAGDEDSRGALIWDGSSGDCIDSLKTDLPVLDLVDMKINHKLHLLALTDKSLKVYGWNSS